MRDIEGIEKVLKVLKPHFKEVNANFELENNRYKSLLNREHDVLGRVLKSHLIVEHYIDRFLLEKYKIENVSEARLSFSQKVKLLPDKASAVAFIKPGILRLNSVRNKFGHSLNFALKFDDVNSIRQILKTLDEDKNFIEPVECIETFTTIVVAFLIVPPIGLQELFLEAFSDIRIRPTEEI